MGRGLSERSLGFETVKKSEIFYPSFESKAPRFEDEKKQSLDFSTPLRNLREVPSKNLQQHSQ